MGFIKAENGELFSADAKWRLVPKSNKRYYLRGYDVYHWQHGHYEFVKKVSTQFIARELVNELEADNDNLP